MSKSSPPEFVDALFRVFCEGQFNDAVALPTVFEITGQKPRTFDQWVAAHLQEFR